MRLFYGSFAIPSDASSPSELALTIRKRHDLETWNLGPFTVPRLFNGLWQLSSPAWGSGSAEKQDSDLVRLVEAGLVATDMADHYVAYADLPSHVDTR